MTKKMLVDAAQPREVRIAITDRNHIEHFDFVTSAKSQLKGNIYLAKVTRIEPALQAAFVEYGGDKQGFLSFSEIHPDYYQIPIADRKKLIEEARLAEEQAEQEEEERDRRREEQRRGRRNRRGGKHSDAEDDMEAGENTPSDEDAEHTEGKDRPSREPSFEGSDGSMDADGAESEALDEESSGEEGEDGAPKRRGRRRRGGRRRPFNKRTTQEESAPKIETESDLFVETEETGDDAEPEAAHETRHEAEAGAAAEHSDEAGEPEEQEDQPQAETISDGEPGAEEGRKRFARMSRRYKIQEVIKPGQIVLVQVIKEERGNKGVSLSTYISLAGRYCVLMPNSPKDGGISRKIGSFDDRQRLKDIAAELKELRGMSAIIRTAGIDRTKTEIKRDYEYLIKLWNQIRDTALASTAPALVYEEGNIIKRSIRDYYVPEIEEIVVAGEEAFKEAKDFMKMIMPSHAARVKEYNDNVPLFHREGIERQLEHLHEPTVRLRSGGYIVINPTEALISIDVNSGRQTTERNVEETAFKTNLEAAGEIARQLKLRDLGGLIVIDFIDMNYGKHRRVVERSFKDALKTDRAKIQAGHISAFGLLELSRQRLGPNIYETTTTKCHVCKGAGILRSPEALAVSLLREMQANAATGDFVELIPTVTPEMAAYLLNRYRHQITDMEQNFDVVITVRIDPAMDPGTYKLETFRKHKPKGDDRGRDNQRERGRRGGSGRDNNQHRKREEETPVPAEQETPEAAETESTETESDATHTEEKREGRGRSRGRRGGRNRRGRGGNRDRENAPSDEVHDIAHDAIVMDADAVAHAEVSESIEQEAPAEKPARRGRKPKAEAKVETTEAAEKKPGKASSVTASEAADAAEDDSSPDDGKPRKSGWWRKVVQG